MWRNKKKVKCLVFGPPWVEKAQSLWGYSNLFNNSILILFDIQHKVKILSHLCCVNPFFLFQHCNMFSMFENCSNYVTLEWINKHTTKFKVSCFLQAIINYCIIVWTNKTLKHRSGSLSLNFLVFILFILIYDN